MPQGASLLPAGGDGGGGAGEPRALGWDGFPALGDLPASRHLSPLGEAEFMSGLPGAGDCAWPARPIPRPEAGVMATSITAASRLDVCPGWMCAPAGLCVTPGHLCGL